MNVDVLISNIISPDLLFFILGIIDTLAKVI